MSDVTDPLDWAARAEEDYIIAVAALRRKKPLTYGSTFHAQQLAEKYMKGLLVERKRKPLKTHDLAKLNELCQEAGILIGLPKEKLSDLSLYAVEIRYPGDDPTIEDAREALETAKTIRKFARKFLGIK